MSIENSGVTPWALDEPVCSSDSVWYRDNVNLSISDVLDDKAPTSHAHTGYADANHEHSGYADAEHTHSGYASEDHTHTGFAAEDHTHTGFAAEGHGHAMADITGLIGVLLTSENGGVKKTITGDVLATIASWPIGIYTAYSSGATGTTVTNAPKTVSSWRYLVHKNVAAFGWVLAFGSCGSVFSNYLDNGTWRGWKAIWDANPDPLWAGSDGNGVTGYYMTDGHTVTPSKKLSACRSGWLLIWSDYNADSNAANDYDFSTCFIPRIRPDGETWSGQSFLCDVAVGMTTTTPYTETRCIKWLHVYDNKIVGHAANNQAPRNDVVLRAVYEF